MISDANSTTRPNTGGWAPPDIIASPPILVWPPRPKAILKLVFGVPGYLFPWTLVYGCIALLTWLYLTPDLEEMKTLEVGWIAQLFIVNLVLIVAITSAWHLHLYIRKAQGIKFKYNKRWPSDGDAFLFRSQLLDNMTWTIFGGVPVWTAYLTLTFWMMANGWLPYMSWTDHPVYCAVFMLLIHLWHELHFYFVHRLIHWPPLYRWIHSVHHRNANPGPWSGLSMHPLEHVLYFSAVLIHWALPSNPLLVIYNLQYLALGPCQDHCGFAKIDVNGKAEIDAATYVHYLHHRYFEVNYGGGLMPLDKWFGTWHDGSAQAHEAMNRRFLKEPAAPPPEIGS
jgi:sterol desaturase/sphingolipid hydroxylase (fatty acid hydroxylase superfamily)